MTISTSTNQITYTGDGVSVAFAYPYPFITTADLQVYVAGVVQTTGFSVAGVAPTGGSGTYQSGTVTFVAAPASLATVLIYSDPDLLQSTSLPPNDPFPSKTVEKMIDKVTLLIQRIYGKIGNALTIPVGESISGVLPAAALRANNLLSFDSTGAPTVVAASAGTATALTTDLASTLLATKNSGQVGFNYSLSYVANTIGWGLKQGAINLAWMSGYDATGVADSAAAVTAAIALLPSTGGALYVPGICKLASTITVNKPCLIFGPGKGGNSFTAGFVTSHATADMFQVTAASVNFADLSFTASAVRSAGYFINFSSGSAAGNSFCGVQRCSMTQNFNAIGLTGAGAASTIRVVDVDIFTTIIGGIGVNITQTASSVDIVLRDMFIVGPAGNLVAGVQVFNCGDLTLSHVSTVRCAVGLNIVPTSGKTVQVVTVSDSFFDSGLSYGIQTNPAAGGIVSLLKVINTWACSNAFGIILNPSATGLTKRVEIVNCTLSNNTAGSGVYIGGSTVTNTLIEGGSMAANTNGIHVLAGSTKFSIHGARCGTSGEFGPNTGYGILLAAGATSDFSITGCDLQTNTTGNLTDGASGTGKLIWGNLGYGFASAVYDPPNLADGAGVTTTVTVPGALLGDTASATFSLDLQGITVTSWVSVADTVSVRFQNESGGALDLASGTLRAYITRRT